MWCTGRLTSYSRDGVRMAHKSGRDFLIQYHVIMMKIMRSRFAGVAAVLISVRRVMLELLDIFVQLLRSFSVSRRVLLLLLVSVLVVLLAWVLVVKLLVSILELLLVSVLVMLLAWVLVLLLVSVLALRLLPILVLVPVLVRISDSCTAMLS